MIDNSIALVSLLIAIIGGVPGVIAIIQHVRERPRLRYICKHMIVGLWTTGDHTRPVVFLTGTVANGSKTPVMPDHFDLSVHVSGQWRPCTRWRIFDDDAFPGTGFTVEFTRPPNELDLQQRRQRITYDDPADGHLKFFMEGVSLQEARDALLTENLATKMRITCHDVFGQEYEMKVIQQTGLPGLITDYPHHQMRVIMHKDGNVNISANAGTSRLCD